MKENRDFKGVWIPKEIWLNTDLSIIEKVLLVEIDSLDNSDRGCFASNEYLANFVQLSEGRVANIISDLKNIPEFEERFLRLNQQEPYRLKATAIVHRLAFTRANCACSALRPPCIK